MPRVRQILTSVESRIITVEGVDFAAIYLYQVFGHGNPGSEILKYLKEEQE